jgi:subtilisin family serine protease
MTKSTKAILIAAAVSLLVSFPLYSASIEEFQTEEYYASNLDLINAAEAYAKGYTGKGITIGINDTPVNLEHESFADKTGSKYVGSISLEGINWNEYSHGSHVGGIAAGSKNGKVMHGVAFDAITLAILALACTPNLLLVVGTACHFPRQSRGKVFFFPMRPLVLGEVSLFLLKK